MAGLLMQSFARMSVAGPSHASNPRTGSASGLTFSSSLRGSPLLTGASLRSPTLAVRPPRTGPGVGPAVGCSARNRMCFNRAVRSVCRVAPAATRPGASASRAAVFQVHAKQNALGRQRTSEKARVYNKSQKSAIATRVKKVRHPQAALETITAAVREPGGCDRDTAPE